MKNGSLVIESPYNPDFVDAIKKIPYRFRKWDGEYWTVAKEYADEAYEMCLENFQNVEEERE